MLDCGLLFPQIEITPNYTKAFLNNDGCKSLFVLVKIKLCQTNF